MNESNRKYVQISVMVCSSLIAGCGSNVYGCQSWTWSQRGTKVNRSHHGDNPLLRPTGIQIATKCYATLHAMAPTNNKTVHQTSFTPYREQPRSTLIVVAYPLLALSSTNRTNVPTSFDQQFQVSQGHTSYKNKENYEVHGGGGLELVKPAREPASSRPKPCASLKKPHASCPFAAPSGPRRKKNDRGQRSAFPSEISLFALSILAHRGSALPWLVNDRATLRLRRIWCGSPPKEKTVFFPLTGGCSEGLDAFRFFLKNTRKKHADSC